MVLTTSKFAISKGSSHSSPSWALWSFDQSSCLSPLSPILYCLFFPFKFFPSLSFSHSASDDDAQSGYRKFRQNCSFLLYCTVLSIMKIQIVFDIDNWKNCCSSGAIGQRAVLISSSWCKRCGGCEFKPHLEHIFVPNAITRNTISFTFSNDHCQDGRVV